MKKTDYILAICAIIGTIIKVMQNRKLIHTNIKAVYDTRGFKIANNYVTIACSVSIIICYTALAFLAWILKFNLSVFGFYVCLLGVIPVTIFSIYFHRVNYLTVFSD